MEMLALDELAQAGASEFLFVLTPLKLVGATGVPVNPIAILV
jgi:kynurenine formamidase